MPAPNTPESILARLVEEDRGYVTPCWVWQGWCNDDGYGVVGFAGSMRKVHHVVREILGGVSVSGTEYDHLCRVRSCARPDHMDLVTHRLNVVRGAGPTALNAVKTHCLNGHPFIGENLKIRIRSNGQIERLCITCNRQRAAAFNAAKSAARRAAREGVSA